MAGNNNMNDIQMQVAEMLLHHVNTLINSQASQRTFANAAKNTANAQSAGFDSSASKLSNSRDWIELTRQMKLVNAQMSDFKDTVHQNSQALKDNLNKQAASIKGFMQIMDNKGLDKAMQKINDLGDSSSELGKQLKDASKNARDLGDYLDETSQSLYDHNEILKEHNVISLKDIKGIKDKLDALKKLAKTDEQRVKLEEIESMSWSNAKKREIEILIEKVDLDKDELVVQRQRVSSIVKNQAISNRVVDNTKQMGSALVNAAGLSAFTSISVASGLALMLSGAKQAWGEYTKLGSVGFSAIGGTIKDFFLLSKNVIAMGLSMEAYTKMLSENKNLIARVGVDGFNNSITESQKILMKWGENTEEAARGALAFANASIAAGNKIKTSSDVVDVVNGMTDSFTKLKAISDENSESFSKHNLEVFNSTAMQIQFARMDKDKRKNMITDIGFERARLAQAGLNFQQQSAIINKTQDLLNGKVTDRFDQSGKMMQAAIMSGNGDIAGRIRELMLMGGRASSAQKSELSDLIARVMDSTDQMTINGDIGREHLANVIQDNISFAADFRQKNNASPFALTDKELNNRIVGMENKNAELQLFLARAYEALNSSAGQMAMGFTIFSASLIKGIVGGILGSGGFGTMLAGGMLAGATTVAVAMAIAKYINEKETPAETELREKQESAGLIVHDGTGDSSFANAYNNAIDKKVKEIKNSSTPEMILGREFLNPRFNKDLKIPSEIDQSRLWDLGWGFDPKKSFDQKEFNEQTDSDAMEAGKKMMGVILPDGGMDFINQMFGGSAGVPGVPTGPPTSTETQSSYTGTVIPFTGTTKNNIPTRANNPGDITYGKQAIGWGATGYIEAKGGIKISTFPSTEAGILAQRNLLLSDKYKNMTPLQVPYTWSPEGGGNDPDAISQRLKKAGFDNSKTMQQLSPADMDKYQQLYAYGTEGYTGPWMAIGSPLSTDVASNTIPAYPTTPSDVTENIRKGLTASGEVSPQTQAAQTGDDIINQLKILVTLAEAQNGLLTAKEIREQLMSAGLNQTSADKMALKAS